MIVRWIGALAAALLLTGAALAADAPLMRISTENTAGHVQTRAVQRFVEAVRRQVGGRLDVELHHSAELFRDSDVIKALRQGKVEMAVPGTWQLDRVAPDVAVFLLPALYGRDTATNYRLRDGEVGRAINLGLEQHLGVKVLGRWIDLGFAHVYSLGKPIARHQDLAGMKIRVAGGAGNELRLKLLGALPVTIPWPDLPTALARRSVDGVLTTHETVVSARLWEQGIRYGFEDHQYFAQYIPLVDGRFWSKLPPDLRQILEQVWEETVDAARAEAAAAQAAARATLVRHGVVLTTPPPDVLAAWRRKMLAGQDELVRQLGIGPALADRVGAELERVE